jgi:hypothetical protein
VSSCRHTMAPSARMLPVIFVCGDVVCSMHRAVTVSLWGLLTLVFDAALFAGPAAFAGAWCTVSVQLLISRTRCSEAYSVAGAAGGRVGVGVAGPRLSSSCLTSIHAIVTAGTACAYLLPSV